MTPSGIQRKLSEAELAAWQRNRRDKLEYIDRLRWEAGRSQRPVGAQPPPLSTKTAPR